MDNDDTLLNNRGPQPGAETVYGTDDNNMVMSEKVCKINILILNNIQFLLLIACNYKYLITILKIKIECLYSGIV